MPHTIFHEPIRKPFHEVYADLYARRVELGWEDGCRLGDVLAPWGEPAQAYLMRLWAHGLFDEAVIEEVGDARPAAQS